MKITSRDQFSSNKLPLKLPSTSRNQSKKNVKDNELLKQDDNTAAQTERKIHSRASSINTYETILKNKQAVMNKIKMAWNLEPKELIREMK